MTTTTQFLLFVILVTSCLSTTLMLFEIWNLRAGINDPRADRPLALVTATETATVTNTATVTHTTTKTATETVTKTATATATVTETATATVTETITTTATATVTVTASPSIKISEITNKWVRLLNPQLDKETDPWETENYCIRQPDVSGYCIYKNLCFDGKYFLFMDKTVKEIKTMDKIPLLAFEQYPGWDARYRFPNKFPIPDTKYIPYGHTDLNLLFKILPPSAIDPNSVTWLDGNLYYAKPQHANINPFFFAKDNMVLWELGLINKTIGNQLPSIDHLMIPRNDIPPGWSVDLLNILFLQPHTKLWINPDIEAYFGIDNALQSNSTSGPKPPIMCMKRTVVIADKPRIFSGIEHAELFRNTIYDALDIPRPAKRGFSRPANYVPKVFITGRPPAFSRSFYNVGELESLLKHYNLQYNYSTPFPAGTSLGPQVKAFQDVDLYIIVHGGGAINSIFLPAHASIIEIFPYGMKNPVYENIAINLGLTYMAVRSWHKPGPSVSGVLWNEEWFQKCENSSGQEHNDAFPICNNYAKNGIVWIPIEEMENTLVEAFDAQGINIRKFATQRFTKTTPFRKTNWYDKANIDRNHFRTLVNQTVVIEDKLTPEIIELDNFI